MDKNCFFISGLELNKSFFSTKSSRFTIRMEFHRLDFIANRMAFDQISTSIYVLNKI